MSKKTVTNYYIRIYKLGTPGLITAFYFLDFKDVNEARKWTLSILEEGEGFVISVNKAGIL